VAKLAEVVADRSRRQAVLDDCVRLIEAEVADKKGLTGMAVKAAFKSVAKLRPGMVRHSMDALLDDFSYQVDPFWAECQSSGAAPRAFFSQKKKEIANALLSITDRRAERADNKVLVKAYKGLRGKAVEHIGDAMPRFADLVQKHAS
jgi:hypothetical protein